MRTPFLIILFLFSVILIQAQPAQPSYKTPEASALAKSIEYPVSNNTGIPAISIPLFSVSSGSLNYGVQLSYHSAGIKVGQLPGWVGMNWSINSAPQITRTINGLSDFNGYLGNNIVKAYDPSNSSLPNDYLNRLDKSLEDEQPDEFNYSLMNKSGKFMYQKYNDQSYKAIPIPYDQLDIQYHSSTQSFTILDADGTKYEFGGTGYIEQTHLSNSPDDITAWKCSMIVSANLKDTITFDYQPIHTKYRGVFSEQVELYDGDDGSLTGGYKTPIPFDPGDFSEESLAVGVYRPNPVAMKTYSGAPSPFINTYFIFAPLGDQTYNFGSPNIYFDNAAYQPEPYGNTTVMQIRDLKQINYKGNKVEFFSRNLPYDALDSIRVTNYLGQYIKSIRFDNPGTIQLTGVKFCSGQFNNEVYKFDYFPGLGFDSETNIPTDAWGYPNPSNAPPGSSLDMFNGSTIPYQWVNSKSTSAGAGYSIQNYSFPIGNSSLLTNEDDMKGAMLKRITYPDGGFTEFEFEANRYLRYGTDTLLAGGLRIKSIKNYTSEGVAPATEKFFKYGANEDGIGIITTDPQLISYEYDQIGNFQPPHPDQNYNVNANFPNFRKRTFVKSCLDINSFSNGAAVNYTYITVYDNQDGHQTGKTTYFYNVNHSNLRYVGTPITQFQTDLDNGQLLSETHYAYLNGAFVWHKIHSYYFENYIFPDKIHVGKVFNRYVLMGDVRQTTTGDPDAVYGNFQYIKFGLNMGYSRIVKETDSTRVLSNLSSVTGTQKLYYYDNVNHIYPTRVVWQNSKNETLVTYTSYPQDYASDNGMVSSLIANHKLNYPIEKVIAKRGGIDKIISGALNQYLAGPENYYNKLFAIESNNPIPISSFKFSNVAIGQWPEIGSYQSISTDTKYNEKSKFVYDSHGNVAQITNNLSQTSTYLWSYKGLYPTIEIKNVDYASVQAAIGSGPLSAFENSSPNKAAIDNLVASIYTAFPNVLISSYVYQPLIGMTSATDPKGLTTYYEYDNFQRLVNIKDKDGNIVKHTDYHYQNQ